MQQMRKRQEYRPVGEILIDSGRITPEQLEEAVEYKKHNGGRLGQALIALGLVDEKELTSVLQDQGRIPCMNLRPEVVNPEVAKGLEESLARKYRALPINHIAGTTTVAMNDPVDVYTIDLLSARLKSKVLAVYADPATIDECIELAFRAKSTDEDELTAMIDSDVFADVQLESDSSGDDDDWDENEDEAPVINLIQAFLKEAYEARASDIHLEPRGECFVVRFRVDGTLYERLTLRKGWARPCVARLKVMSNLDIAQRRIPQDGRAQIEIGGNKIDLRIATSPTLQGEAAVIRILDGGRELSNLSSLGLRPEQEEHLRRMVQGSDGFMLAVGPTGSGKTTTLYSLLSELNTPDRKIITLEDPVENQLDSLTQINTNAKAGLTFATGLRSILRQDPDVVLVGEIRDTETASIAIQAAMTGHLVLSTLHTVGAAETITRLQEMGIVHYLLSDTLRGVVAQRLVRRICTNCKEEMPPNTALMKRMGLEAESEASFCVGVGCERCAGTGYRGRLGLYEIMLMTSEVSDALRKGKSTSELREIACATAGMTTLQQEGITRARAGETTLEEVLATTARG